MNPYYKDTTVTLYLSECLAGMKELPDGLLSNPRPEQYPIYQGLVAVEDDPFLWWADEDEVPLTVSKFTLEPPL